jgi:GNAT superfamily N-acetyltransferase
MPKLEAGIDMSVVIETISAGSSRAEQAVALILEVQEMTDLPPRGLWEPGRLAEHTRRRHETALSVWVALDEQRVVGHGLIRLVPANHPEFSRVSDLTIHEALAAGHLLELGGLTVHPSWQRKGIGEALVSARLAWISRLPEPMVAVSVVWQNSVGSQMLARRHGVCVGLGINGPYDIFRYNLASPPISHQRV